MTIDQLPSGKYRVRLQINGKRYTRILDHYPKKSELERLFAGKIDLYTSASTVSFSTAYYAFVEDKRNVWSPTTEGTYQAAFNRLSPAFTVKKLNSIDNKVVQREVSNLTGKYASSTIKSTLILIRAVIHYYDITTRFTPTIPQEEYEEIYIPSDEEIKIILEETKGTMYEIAMKVACFGLRLGEICALTPDDVYDGEIHIDKEMVLVKGKPIIKEPKTPQSKRSVKIPQELIDLIHEKGYVYKGAKYSITNKLYQIQKKHNLNRFSLHKFRHYSCSKCIDLGMDFVTIQRMHGWKDFNIIMKVYGHVMREKEKKQIISDEIGKLFS